MRVMDELDHFDELRRRIDAKLTGLQKKEHAKYPWLYGALGNPESDVMFICENPSRTGVEWAARKLRHLGIEAQWRGHRADRLRDVICDLKLKRGGPDDRGGWRCYITNVIKSMDTVKDFSALSWTDKAALAREWADVLQWEIRRVRPGIVFCVGRKSERAVQDLQGKQALDLHGASLQYVWHYSTPRGDSVVWAKMREGIVAGMRLIQPGNTGKPEDYPTNSVHRKPGADH